MVNSKAKGNRGELAARDKVREHWHAPECVRAAQVSGKFSADLLYALPEAHVEVKNLKRMAVFGHYHQAQGDAKAGEVPVLLLKADGEPWLVAFRIEDTTEFIARVLTNQKVSELLNG